MRTDGQLVYLDDARELRIAAGRARPFPRPRFAPTVDGTVILTLGSGAEQVEEHLTLAAARALLDELADAIDHAAWLERVGKEGRADG